MLTSKNETQLEGTSDVSNHVQKSQGGSPNIVHQDHSNEDFLALDTEVSNRYRPVTSPIKEIVSES